MDNIFNNELKNQIFDDLKVWGVGIVRTQIIEGRVVVSRIDPVSLEGEDVVKNPDNYPDVQFEKLADHQNKYPIK